MKYECLDDYKFYPTCLREKCFCLFFNFRLQAVSSSLQESSTSSQSNFAPYDAHNVHQAWLLCQIRFPIAYGNKITFRKFMVCNKFIRSRTTKVRKKKAFSCDKSEIFYSILREWKRLHIHIRNFICEFHIRNVKVPTHYFFFFVLFMC